MGIERAEGGKEKGGRECVRGRKEEGEGKKKNKGIKKISWRK
jgi:hypothetical protein